MLGGTMLWCMIQVIVWMFGLQIGMKFERVKSLLLGALIGFPSFVLILGLLKGLVEDKLFLWDCVIAPIFVAYIIGISIVGLHFAQRILKTRKGKSLS